MASPLSRARTTWRSAGVAMAAVAIAVLFLVPNGALGSRGGSSPRTAFKSPLSSTPTLFRVAVAKSSQFDWPELHRDPGLTGYASNSPLSSLNASSLGVAWATNLYASSLDSPAVAYDPILGETLVYIGTESGNVLAVNLADGQIVWGVWLGSPIRSSPVISNGSVYVTPFSTPTLYRLNATTGTTQCSTVLPAATESTPTLATPPGGVSTLFIGSAGSGASSGPFSAINAANCHVEWKFTGYHKPAGSWDSASYAVNASGGGVVLFGTDDPDSSIYALNALTGHLLWRFQCFNPAGADDDVGAGAAISPPGKNGFAQGAVYVTNKAGIAYALHLNNGTLIWETNFNALAGIVGAGAGQSRSTPALDGSAVVFGFAEGLFDLNATTGAETWMYKDPTATESIASPAIVGGRGHGLAITGDVAGDLDVLSMVNVSQLYTYPTGGWIAASPAISDGNILIDSTDGILYDFAVGGGNHAILPTTSISSPLPAAVVTNPNGDLTVYGNATDPGAVVAVDVAIQSSGPAGKWWDAATASWSPGPIDNRAVLGSPGAPSTSWTLAFPVPGAGGTFSVIANAVSSSGQSDVKGVHANFAVNYTTTGPHLETSSAFVAPGGSLTVNGGGFGRSVSVTLRLLGKTLATVTSSANGSLPPTTVVIPAKSLFGQTSLVAKAKISGRSSSAAITVTNNWAQLGDAPGHAGFEANDPTLHNIIFPGNNLWLQVAWRFDARAPINASPAVVDGVAYVGDTVGNLFAVDIHNGGLLWNYTLSSGARIDGAPAVDPALGLVFVGAADGTLDAVHTATGTLAWSVSVGGNVSAPVLSGGKIYITSSTGAVEARTESTGAVTWSVTLASPITGAPSLNASVHLLVVGESDGHVIALNATTGLTRWSYGTRSAVTAAPMVAGGKVYFGSNDHKFYALNELNGTLRWSFRTAGAVQDTATVDNQNMVWIGSNDGTLHILQATSGVEDFNFSIGSPIVGVSSAKGVTVFEDAAGTIGAQKTFLDIAGWRYSTGAGLVTAPVIVDTTVFVCAGDGSFYAFTSLGQAPV